MAKPDYFGAQEGIWCPVKIFTWSWGGEAFYNKSLAQWQKVDGSFFSNIPQSSQIYFPDWSHKVESGGEPKWRQK